MWALVSGANGPTDRRRVFAADGLGLADVAQAGEPLLGAGQQATVHPTLMESSSGCADSTRPVRNKAVPDASEVSVL
jgi:hypothetical protein